MSAYEVNLRQQFIQATLAAQGHINRADIVAKFGISANQATADLRMFEAAHPCAMRYDHRHKAYFAHNAPAPDKPSAVKKLLGLEPKLWRVAAQLGDGNITEGVRRALVMASDQP